MFHAYSILQPACTTVQILKQAGVHSGVLVAVWQAAAGRAGATHGGARRAASAVPLLLAPHLLCLRLPPLLLLTSP